LFSLKEEKQEEEGTEMWTRHWICLSFLVVTIQSRHFPTHHHQNQQEDELSLGQTVSVF
jgi:hypothetical protein